MTSRLLERMLTGQLILYDFLRAIKRHSLDDYDDKGDSRNIIDADEIPNGAQEMCPIRFRGAPNPL